MTTTMDELLEQVAEIARPGTSPEAFRELLRQETIRACIKTGLYTTGVINVTTCLVEENLVPLPDACIAVVDCAAGRARESEALTPMGGFAQGRIAHKFANGVLRLHEEGHSVVRVSWQGLEVDEDGQALVDFVLGEGIVGRTQARLYRAAHPYLPAMQYWERKQAAADCDLRAGNALDQALTHLRRVSPQQLRALSVRRYGPRWYSRRGWHAPPDAPSVDF